MKFYPLLAATMLAPLAGCTTHLESGLAQANDPQSRKGIAYFLPETRFDVEVTWTVTGCTASGPELDAKIVAKTATEPDPSALQVIDYTSLNAFTKTSGVKVEFYDNGAIKSINASAEDRTGAIIEHAVSAAGKIALAAIGGESSPDGCSAKVNEALDKVDGLSGNVDAATQNLENAQATLESLTSRLAQTKSGKNDAAAAALLKQIDVVEQRKRELQAAQDELAPQIKRLTYTGRANFVANDPESARVVLSVPTEIWEKKWLPVNLISAAARKQQENSVHIELRSVGNWQDGVDIETSGASRSAQREAGIRYRVAVPATLVGCLGKPCTVPAAAQGTAGSQIGRALPVRVLSRATTFYLPFASKGFSNGALEARFAQDGTLTFASYDQKKAPGEGLFATVDTAADSVGGVIKGIRAGQKTPLQQTKVETDLVQAQNALDLARQASVKSPNAAVEDEAKATEAQTKLLEAQVAKANAELALRKAQTELASAAGGAVQ